MRKLASSENSNCGAWTHWGVIAMHRNTHFIQQSRVWVQKRSYFWIRPPLQSHSLDRPELILKFITKEVRAQTVELIHSEVIGMHWNTHTPFSSSLPVSTSWAVAQKWTLAPQTWLLFIINSDQFKYFHKFWQKSRNVCKTMKQPSNYIGTSWNISIVRSVQCNLNLIIA